MVLSQTIFQGIGDYLLKGKLATFVRGIDRVGQWVQLQQSRMKKLQLHPSISLKQGIKSNLHQLIETNNSLSDILNQSIENTNDTPNVCNHNAANYCPILEI